MVEHFPKPPPERTTTDQRLYTTLRSASKLLFQHSSFTDAETPGLEGELWVWGLTGCTGDTVSLRSFQWELTCGG